jgi:SAM-dependent MidA family methyltransferase
MATANPVPNALEQIRTRIATAPEGRLPWVEVMRLALYEPGVGYYRQGVRRIGREGDFFTSVSAGPLFGRLLAEQARQVWVTMGRPAEFVLIEQGAHDATLASDILSACQELDPALAAAARYLLVEPDPVLQEAQRRTLARLDGIRASWLADWSALPPTPAAFFLCNELVDALPVHRLRWTGSTWRELWVALDASSPCGLQFVEGALSDSRLEARAAALGTQYPDGYTTDICLEADDWVQALAAAPFSGAVLLLDYGLPAAEYYAPERSDGTLRRYFRHRMDGEVLENLGDADLTTDVNFTCLVQSAEKTGLKLACFIEQGRFLTRLFADSLSSRPITMDAANKRQFHTLTHPGFLGRNFHALLLAKGIPATDLASATEQEAARQRLGL